MSPTDEDRLDADVPALALQALKAAQDRAVRAGHPMVVVRDGQLVRVCGDTVTVLKQLPGRKKVPVHGPSAPS